MTRYEFSIGKVLVGFIGGFILTFIPGAFLIGIPLILSIIFAWFLKIYDEKGDVDMIKTRSIFETISEMITSIVSFTIGVYILGILSDTSYLPDTSYNRIVLIIIGTIFLVYGIFRSLGIIGVLLFLENENTSY